MPLLADAQALQEVLVDLVALPIRDLVQLWRQYGDQAEFRAILEAALPQILAPYLQGAAMVTAQQYTEQLPESPFQAKPYGDIPVERIMGTIAWALNAPGSAPPLDRIAGAVKRMVFDASRQTALLNLEAEYGFEFSDGGTEELGTLWARYASATACGFCKVLATRGAVYTSKEAAEQVVGRGVDLTVADRRMIAAGQLTKAQARGRRSVYRNEKQAARQGAKVGDTRKSVGTLRGSQERGDRYHDNCRCIAVAVRPGQVYEPPDYVQQWEKDYAEASRGTKGIGAIGRRMDAIAQERQEAAKDSGAGVGNLGPNESSAPEPQASSGDSGGIDNGGRRGGRTGFGDPGDEFRRLSDGSKMPFRPSQVPPLNDGDYAHFEGTDGTGLGGHKFGTGWRGQTEFPGWVSTINDLQDVLNAVVSNTARIQPGKYGQYELRALVAHEGQQMIVQVVLFPDGSPNTIYPISGDGVYRNNPDGPGKSPVPLNIDDLLGW